MATAPGATYSPAQPTSRSSGTFCSIRSWHSARTTWTAGSDFGAGRIYDLLEMILTTYSSSPIPAWTNGLDPPATSPAACCSSTPSGAHGATSPTTTTSTAPLRSSSTRPAVFLRLFHATAPTSRKRSSPRSGTSPPSSPSSRARACSTSARAGAGSASTLPRSPLRRDRRDATASSTSLAASAPPRRASRRAVRFDFKDYRKVDGPLRSRRLGRHVRACRRQSLRHLLPQGARPAEPTTAWR